MGPANGLLAHLAVSVSIGSTSSHRAHFSSVLPSVLGTGTNLFPQCKQRATLSIASPPRFFRSFLCLRAFNPSRLRLNRWNGTFVPAFYVTFDGLKGEERCRRLSIGYFRPTA